MAVIVMKGSEFGPPDGWVEASSREAHLTNFDFSVTPGTEEALRAGGVWCRYAGWNFNGQVWFNGEGGFSCQVWHYKQPVETHMASTLDELMRSVSDEWGYE